MAAHPSVRPVLLIDDSYEDLFLAKRLLVRAGVVNPILTVKGAEEAMCFLESAVARGSTEHVPCVIYCDIKMPVHTGFDMLQWVRNHSTLKDLPFFILSGADLDSDKQRAEQLGATGYLAKFPSPDVFKQTIDSVLLN